MHAQVTKTLTGVAKDLGRMADRARRRGLDDIADELDAQAVLVAMANITMKDALDATKA